VSLDDFSVCMLRGINCDWYQNIVRIYRSDTFMMKLQLRSMYLVLLYKATSICQPRPMCVL
jgi:hypothetical protein